MGVMPVGQSAGRQELTSPSAVPDSSSVWTM
jgi:hypothetical protein